MPYQKSFFQEPSGSRPQTPDRDAHSSQHPSTTPAHPPPSHSTNPANQYDRLFSGLKYVGGSGEDDSPISSRRPADGGSRQSGAAQTSTFGGLAQGGTQGSTVLPQKQSGLAFQTGTSAFSKGPAAGPPGGLNFGMKPGASTVLPTHPSGGLFSQPGAGFGGKPSFVSGNNVPLSNLHGLPPPSSPPQQGGNTAAMHIPSFLSNQISLGQGGTNTAFSNGAGMLPGTTSTFPSALPKAPLFSTKAPPASNLGAQPFSMDPSAAETNLHLPFTSNPLFPDLDPSGNNPLYAGLGQDDLFGGNTESPNTLLKNFSFSTTEVPRGQKRQRDNGTLPRNGGHAQFLEPLPKSLDFEALSSGLIPSLSRSALSEPDQLILETEQLLLKLETHNVDEIAHNLGACWSRHIPVPPANPDSIGPAEDASSLQKAQFLASFLLTLTHPNTKDSTYRPMASRGGRGPVSQSDKPVSMATALLDWINTHHDSSAAQIEQLAAMEGGYSAHPDFWDIVAQTALRGRFDMLLKLLRGANFSVARSLDSDHIPVLLKFTDGELCIIDRAIDMVVDLFEKCPALVSGNWDIQGDDWRLFRQHARQVKKTLEEHSLGGSGDNRMYDQDLLPVDVAEPLGDILGQILCSPEEVMTCCFDWLEGSIFLAVWWTGESVSDFDSIFRRSRRQSVSGQKPSNGFSWSSSPQAIKHRLAHAFAHLSKDPDLQDRMPFQIHNPMEVAIASLIHEQAECAINLIRSHSLLLSVALAEIGSKAGWLEGSNKSRQNILGAFELDELAVFNYGRDPLELPNPSVCGQLQQEFASQLFDRSRIGTFDGWELALEVLTRLGDEERKSVMIREMLDKVDIEGPGRLDALLNACHRLGRQEYAQKIAERHAEAMLQSHQYGPALLYYARAGKSDKVRDTLDLLCCRCLVQSKEFPARSALDDQLREFIDTPQATLNRISRIDYDAAQILSSSISGYATLRLFYRLRDAELEVDVSDKGKARPGRKLQRLREAASALLALIASAADCIKGGLYDPEIEPVVHIDCLLALMGESLVFISQPKRLLTYEQLLSLVRVIEDLESVSPMVFEGPAELLKTTLQNYINPRANPILSGGPPKKAQNENGIQKFRPGASIFRQQPEFLSFDSLNESTMGSESRPLVIRRAWDWRRGLVENSRSSGLTGPSSEPGVDGHDLLAVMRVLLAQEVSRAWVEEIVVPDFGLLSFGGGAAQQSYVDREAGEDVSGEGGRMENGYEDDIIVDRTGGKDGDVFMSTAGRSGGPRTGLFARG